MKRIEAQAREVYFSTPRKSPSRLGIFEEGYMKGYQAALHEIRGAMEKPNNKQRMDGIKEILEDYEQQGLL